MKTILYLKEWAKALGLWILSILVLYVVFALINWSLYPGDWGTFSRFLTVFLGGSVTYLAFSYLFSDLPKKINRLAQIKKNVS
jgi:hypothetical protein